jgi:hypothetical protein
MTWQVLPLSKETHHDRRIGAAVDETSGIFAQHGQAAYAAQA